jgi:hypothetical protein
MKKIKLEIKLDSLQFDLLSRESERRNLSIEKLVINLIEQNLLETSSFQNSIVADSESTAGLGASKITDSDKNQYKYSVEGDFLTLNLSSETKPHFADIKKILTVVEEIENLEYDDDVSNLSETYKQRLYSITRKDSE